MLVATTLSQDATSASRLDRAVSKILDEPEFRTLKLRQTKYKSPDSGVKTIVLIGDAKSKFDEIEKRLHASVGKSCRITAYPKTTNQPDVYVRKFFFDENQPDRFLCVGLVAQPE